MKDWNTKGFWILILKEIPVKIGKGRIILILRETTAEPTVKEMADLGAITQMGRPLNGIFVKFIFVDKHTTMIFRISIK